ncbi:MAG: IclR family transcriptional regulator [Dehalococcoidales bacterium]
MGTKSYSNSALRVAAILSSFTRDETELTATEISRIAGLPKSTVHYILVSLVTSGLVVRNENNGKYAVGPKLFEIGSVYLRRIDIINIAEPVVKALNELTDEGVTIGTLHGGNMLRILKEESRQPVRYVLPMGESRPAYASSTGKALLSKLSNAEIDNIYPDEKLIKVTEKTIRTKTELKLELENIRNTGISSDREGGHTGVEGIACAIRDSSGKAIAAMSISFPVHRIDEAQRQKFVELVKMGCALISYNLGFHDATNPVRNIQEINQWYEQA